ncbi:MAG: thioredoxin family protein [Planctomycetaceae bacterium]
MTESRDRGTSGWPQRRRGFGPTVRACIAATCLLAGSAFAGDGWLTSYDAAMEAAREQQKPVLTIFTGSDWCPHCQTLEDQVLHTETFRAWASGRLVLLMIDLPKQGISAEERATRSRVCIKYGVRTFPSAVLIDPQGSPITSQSGYLGQSADAWVATLDGHLPKTAAGPEHPAVAALDDAVETAREERRPVLVLVSRPSDSTARKRMESLIEDPEFGSFARENFVVAEIPAAGPAAGERPEALRSLLGDEAEAAEGVAVIVTDDGQTPLHTESGTQSPQRVVSGLRRFLAARQTTRR